MNWLLGAIRLIGATLLDAGRLYRLAPLLPLIAAGAEFAQHAAEMKLGMFASRDAFRALGDAPLRMAFGYVKFAAVMVTMVLSARFWARGTAAELGHEPGIAWRPLVVSLGAMVLLSIPTIPGASPLPGSSQLVVEVALQIASLPLSVLLIAGLLGRHEETLGRVYRHGWGKALRIIALTLVTFAPLQVVHHVNHTLAFGQPLAVLWPIMILDALLVGWMGAVLGTALHHGYIGARAPSAR